MKPSNTLKISCVIPTYNEAPRIARVLDAVVGHPDIGEIIVVDDGSVDNTAEILSGYPSIRYILHPKNQGKSMALYTGITHAEGDSILFLDGDLVGLTPETISSLITPVKNGISDVSISLRKNAPGLWHTVGIDYLSGERVVPKKVFDGYLEQMPQLPPFGCEVFMNTCLIEQKCSIAVVKWDAVSSPVKKDKVGLLRGVAGDIGMMRDIFKVLAFYEPFYQVYKMRRMRVRKPEQVVYPSISLVIPAYNEEKYIAECLDHVTRNSHGIFHEIIVIDNASSDRTAEIARQFPGVRVVRENNKGLTWARQRGYLEATGDVLAYIDADTHMPSGWAERVRKTFRTSPDTVCLSGPYVYYDSSPLQKFFVSLYWDLLGMPMYFLLGYLVVGGNFAIRKETLDAMEGFDTTISFYGEDTNIARRAHEHGKVTFSKSLKMYTSARRLQGQGVLNTAFTYMANFLSEAIRRKPATTSYQDIR